MRQMRIPTRKELDTWVMGFVALRPRTSRMNTEESSKHFLGIQGYLRKTLPWEQKQQETILSEHILYKLNYPPPSKRTILIDLWNLLEDTGFWGDFSWNPPETAPCEAAEWLDYWDALQTSVPNHACSETLKCNSLLCLTFHRRAVQKTEAYHIVHTSHMGNWSQGLGIHRHILRLSFGVKKDTRILQV